MSAFITSVASFLPGAPVGNDAIEDVLGQLPTGASRLRRRILKNNWIQQRHNAIDPATQQPTHTPAQLGAESVRRLLDQAGLSMADLDLLSVGCSIPDHVTPGLASQVHGELGGHPLEIASTHAVCCAGMTALKYAAMAVASGDKQAAVVNAVERCSNFLRAPHFTAELRARSAVETRSPYIGFDQEFLRWMLSDGSGAALIQGRPADSGLSLRIEWIELVSYAHELPSCMYMGAERLDDGSLRGWRETEDLDQALRGGFFNLHQDVKLLAAHIVDVMVRSLEVIRARRPLEPGEIDWLLPHYSSEFFRDKAYAGLARTGFEVPYDKWRSNLITRGNTGCASIFIMLDEFLRGGELQEGQSVLLMVPESGRFSGAWALLRAVAP